MNPWIIAGIVFAVLLLLVLALCFVIGKNFLGNLKRTNPGEKFRSPIDISFYLNGPMKPLADAGLKLMEGLPQEEVWITSYDGLKLHATYFPAPGEQKGVVLGIHGFQSHAKPEYAPHIAFYHSLGYSMLLPNDRAHDLSEGKYITMGVKDRFDCISWANYLVERFGQDVKILLHGVSMGGATVLAAGGEESLPPQVFGIVSDCGYTSNVEQLELQMKNFKVPAAFPKLVCTWCARHVAGFDPYEAQPIEQVKKIRVPVFFVQGAEDFLVPRDMGERLYSACGAPKKRLLMVEGASHAESIAVEPENYRTAIQELFGI